MYKHQIVRIVIAVSILLSIAAIHAFRLGTYFEGNTRIFYYSYVSDVIVAFGIYFLFCINEIQFTFLRPWYAKAALVFGFSTFSEILQAYDIYVLGKTFDVFDILAFAIGTTIAVLVDIILFGNFVTYWNYNKKAYQKR